MSTRHRPKATSVRRLRWPLGLGAAGAGVMAAALWLAAPAPEPARYGVARDLPPAAAAPGAAPMQQAQQMAGSCRTPTTICPLPYAAPVGSICQCGADYGTAVP